MYSNFLKKIENDSTVIFNVHQNIFGIFCL